MRLPMTIFALALASGAFTAPATAQRAELAQRKANVPNEAKKPIFELQTAVNANDVANIPAKLAAAQAAAKTPADKLLVAQLHLKAAVAANDEKAQMTAVEAMIASGGLDPAQIPTVSIALGKLQFKNQQYAQASSTLERALAVSPGNSEVLILLAESRHAQGQVKEAIALLQRAVQAKTAAGQKADEAWYKRAIALAFNANLPSSVELGRQWVAAYPTPANWRDAIRIYRKVGNLDDGATLDALRLARAAGALEGDLDFHLYAVKAIGPAPGEARAVIDEAIAAKKIDPNKPIFKEISTALAANKGMSLAALPALAKEALASPAARLAVRTGDAYYGYGEYAKAAELYRAALGKSGADAGLINLHLGMALARAGDKASATAAFNAVTGPRSELAKFWLLYLATSA